MKFGITRIADLTGLDNIGIPVFASYRPIAKSYCVSYGKGHDSKLAKKSAYMEAAECYFAEKAMQYSVKASELELIDKDAKIIRLHDLQRVLKPNSENQRSIKWVQVDELTGTTSPLIPTDLLHLNMSCNTDLSVSLSSVGLAISESKNKSLIHGICEVVERDAYTLWTMRRIRDMVLTYVSFQSIKSDAIHSLISKITNANLNLLIFDITSDIEVPAFCAVICTENAVNYSMVPPIELVVGLGCNLDWEVALIRAITEAAQGRAGLISGARDDFTRDDYSLRTFNKWSSIYNLLGSNKKKFDNHYNYFDVSYLNTTDHLSKLVEYFTNHTNGKIPIYYNYLGGKEEGLYCIRVIAPDLEASNNEYGYILGKRALRSIH